MQMLKTGVVAGLLIATLSAHAQRLQASLTALVTSTAADGPYASLTGSLSGTASFECRA